MSSRAWKRVIYAALAGNLLVALTKFVATGRVRPAHRPSTATPLSPLLPPPGGPFSNASKIVVSRLG